MNYASFFILALALIALVVAGSFKVEANDIDNSQDQMISDRRYRWIGSENDEADDFDLDDGNLDNYEEVEVIYPDEDWEASEESEEFYE